MKKTLLLIGISASLMGCSVGSNEKADEHTNHEESKPQTTQEQTASQQESTSTSEQDNTADVITNSNNAANADKTNQNEHKEQHSVSQPKEENNNIPAPTTKEPVQEPTVNNPVEEPKKEEPKKENVPTVTKTAEGVIYGLADTNSVEAEFNGEVTTISFDESLTDTINTLPEEAKVQFTYVVNPNGQNVITAIKRLN